ncbi:hypothetical protein ACGFYA_20470 [Streptomyces sp. NPDC048305]|uniref:hypothetical protein n=1 Tax=Streptomyces sp. NPDC048305 TaxID=3365532 RepID=UPI00371C30AE
MKLKVEVLACDIDKAYPAKTYTITASDGRSVSKDLCAEHAEPFEEWLEETGPREEPQPTPTVTPVPVQKPKVAAKQTPAKKTTSPRRRPKITSLAEIEASKQG